DLLSVDESDACRGSVDLAIGSISSVEGAEFAIDWDGLTVVLDDGVPLPMRGDVAKTLVDGPRGRAVDEQQFGVDFRYLIGRNNNNVVRATRSVELPWRLEKFEELFYGGSLAFFGDDSNQRN